MTSLYSLSYYEIIELILVNIDKSFDIISSNGNPQKEAINSVFWVLFVTESICRRNELYQSKTNQPENKMIVIETGGEQKSKTTFGLMLEESRPRS